MALFKILRGNADNLPEPEHDGWAYFTTDTHEFFIDYKDQNGVIQRSSITSYRAIPHLSTDGVYYFSPTITPMPTVELITCGSSADSDAVEIIYSAGNSNSNLVSEEIWKSI